MSLSSSITTLLIFIVLTFSLTKILEFYDVQPSEYAAYLYFYALMFVIYLFVYKG
jgi:hypothetical protein